MELGKISATPMIATKNLGQSRKFYEEVLGVKVSDGDESEVLMANSGQSKFMIYKSDFAGTNKANALVWDVGDKVEDTVLDLKRRGVHFEHYPDLPETELKGDIHLSHGMKLAWFKDPDGNILHVVGH